MKWTAHIEGGPMRVNHAAVSIGDKVFSFGGYCSSNVYKDWQPIPVYQLETSTLRWSQINYKQRNLLDNNIPFERYGHSAVAYGHKVYMWGGRNNAVQCEILACFNTKSFRWSSPYVYGQIPFAKDGHSACLIKNRMYIFGGFEYHTDQFSQDLHYLDLDTMEWKYVMADGEAPSHRDFHTAVGVGDKMYVFGGRGDLNSPYNSQEEIYCPEMYIYDTVENMWTTANPTGTWPEARRSHSSWVYNGHIYIFGGYNGISQTHFNDVWRYSIEKNHWEYWPIKGLEPSSRRRQQCIMVGTKMYLFGGTCPQKIIDPDQEMEPNEDSTKTDKLVDISDMYVLDFSPSLKTLAICTVLDHNIDLSTLPKDVQMDVRIMTVRNRITNRREANQTG